MDQINILMSVNKKFLEHLEELMFSVIYYSSKPINIYLMYIERELNNEDLEKVKEFAKKTKKAQVIPIKFDARSLDGMPVTDDEGAFFGMEAYSRLFCAFLLPEQVEKILWLDADMICTGDIKELYEIELDGKSWAACEDKGIKKEDLDRLGLPMGYHYINSGMLLINVKKLRENYKESDFVKMIRDNHEVLIYPDQDFINKMFAGDIKIVDNKYNLVAKDINYKDLKEMPLIIHYAGSVKPWNDDVSRFNKEFLDPYYESLKLQGESKRDKLEQMLKNHTIYGYKM